MTKVHDPFRARRRQNVVIRAVQAFANVVVIHDDKLALTIGPVDRRLQRDAQPGAHIVGSGAHLRYQPEPLDRHISRHPVQFLVGEVFFTAIRISPSGPKISLPHRVAINFPVSSMGLMPPACM